MVTWERGVPDTGQDLPRDPGWKPCISGHHCRVGSRSPSYTPEPCELQRWMGSRDSGRRRLKGIVEASQYMFYLWKMHLCNP